MRNCLYRKKFVIICMLFFLGINSFNLISATTPAIRTNVTSIQITINNDGSGDPTDKRVDVPTYLPASGITPTLLINFSIIGGNNGTTAFYGDDIGEDWKNITITGDILSSVDETILYHVGTKGDWNCHITPTQVSGVISIGIDWPGIGAAIESIQIVNGIFVIPPVESFSWGQDCNLTVSIFDMDNQWIKQAYVYLIWEEDYYEFNKTIGDGTVGNGYEGKYTFWVTKEDQGKFVSKNITIAVQWYAGYWGYAKVGMTLPSNPPFIHVFLLGKYTNMVTQGDYITVEAENLFMIRFNPFNYLQYTDNKLICFSDNYNGKMFANDFLIGLFNIVTVFEKTPMIAGMADSTLNRILIVAAGVNIKWRDIEIILDKPGATYQIFDGTIPIAPENSTSSAGDAAVIAGEFIQLSTYSGEVTTRLRYLPTHELIGTWTVDI